MELADLQQKLTEHAADNAIRFSQLESKIHESTEMDKITVNPPASNDAALLMAAMGNRGNFNGGDMFGGGGMLGGLVLGSLLRNGNGGLFGGNGDGAGAALGATLRNPPEQNQANMDLMAGIGQVDKAVAVSTAAMEASQAMQSAGIVSQLNAVTGSLATRVEGVKDAVNQNAMVLAQQLNGLNQTTMENRYELSRDISNDGEKTRALITAQYEATLNRQLAEANAAIIELRSDERGYRRARETEVNVSQVVNQAQSQAQQQQQTGALLGLIQGLAHDLQYLKNTNSAINVGSGSLSNTASPTSTNIR